MSLREAIVAIGVDKTDQEIVDALNADEIIGTDSARYTWSGVTERLLYFGVHPDVVDQLIVGMPELPGGKALAASLSSGGVDFSLDAVQMGLAANAERLGPLCDILRSIGVQRRKVYTVYGLESPVSIEDVKAVRDGMNPAKWTQHNVSMSFSSELNSNGKPGITLAISNRLCTVVDGEVVQDAVVNRETVTAADGSKAGNLLQAIEAAVKTYLSE